MSDMNIYAMSGDQIRFNFPRNGNEFDMENGQRYLKLGRIYTVHHTEPYSDRTYVFINEVPNIRFNSIQFEDVPGEQECPDRTWLEIEGLLRSVEHDVLMKQDFKPDSLTAPELLRVKRLYHEFAMVYRFYAKRGRDPEFARQTALNDLKRRHQELK